MRVSRPLLFYEHPPRVQHARDGRCLNPKRCSFSIARAVDTTDSSNSITLDGRFYLREMAYWLTVALDSDQEERLLGF